MLSRLLREPLVQFLLVGAILFGAFRYLQPGNSAIPAPLQTQVTIPAASPGPTPSRQIVLTLDQLTRLAPVSRGSMGPRADAAGARQLVEADVKEEILYREGLALGLDKDDEIVRRRMAQKMQFLAEDVAAAHQPTTTRSSKPGSTRTRSSSRSPRD